MGLDLVVEGCAKTGHEPEWRRLVQRAFADDALSDAEVRRFNEISIPAYERLGAPRVGSDPAADAWIIEARKAKTPEEIAAALKEFSGYHVLRFVESDGVPLYSHGGLYDGVDETSFRGAFLKACPNVIDGALLDAAWEHKLPEAASAYGRELLAAADAAETAPLRPPDHPSGRVCDREIGTSRRPFTNSWASSARRGVGSSSGANAAIPYGPSSDQPPACAGGGVTGALVTAG